MPSVGGSTWWVVVPVKRLPDAKSRLRGALPGVAHEDLVLALVRDTIAAALRATAVVEVVVVTNDAEAGASARALGARVVPDAPDAGLNPAFGHGARFARGHVAALAGDLPALRASELDAALSLAAARSFVADSAGTGTTLLAARAGVPLDPRFGPGSALAHAGSGATPLTGAWPSLRHDVDTVADLRAARELGVGVHTAGLLDAAPYAATVQATVASFDPRRRSGTVLLDDGTRLAFEAPAFDASGLRLLRIGQRVRLHVRDEQITLLSLITM